MERYDDIIDHPHHISDKHPRMTMFQRAAQFAPFSALAGHSQAIMDTARKNQESYLDKDSEEGNVHDRLPQTLGSSQQET